MNQEMIKPSRMNKLLDESRKFQRTRVLGYLFVGFVSWFSVQNLLAQSGGLKPEFQQAFGARGVGLGGACTAAPEDATAIFWNPGALDVLERKTLTLYASNLLLGQSQLIAYAHPTVNIGTFGAAMIRVGLSSNDIEERDENANLIGNFGYTHSLYLLSYGKKIGYNLSFGVNAKIEQQDFERSTSSGFAMDFGLV